MLHRACRLKRRRRGRRRHVKPACYAVTASWGRARAGRQDAGSGMTTGTTFAAVSSNMLRISPVRRSEACSAGYHLGRLAVTALHLDPALGREIFRPPLPAAASPIRSASANWTPGRSPRSS